MGTPYGQELNFCLWNVSIERPPCENAAVLIPEGLSHPETPLGGSLRIPLAGVGHLKIRCLVGNPIEGSTMCERQRDIFCGNRVCLIAQQCCMITRSFRGDCPRRFRDLDVCGSQSLSGDPLGFQGPSCNEDSSIMLGSRRT